MVRVKDSEENIERYAKRVAVGEAMSLTKKQAQQVHARRRAYERYGLTLTKKKRLRAIADIQAGRATLVEKQSLARSVWQVQIDNRPVTVVYDRTRKTLVTVLPPKGAACQHRKFKGQ